MAVRKVEELVRDVMAGHKELPQKKDITPAIKEITQLQGKLSSHFGTKVSVNSDGKKGDIRIPFLSIEDLNRILEILRL